MKPLSAARIAAALVASAMLIPFATAQSGATAQSPSQQQPSATGTSGANDTTKKTDRASERSGEAQSGRMDYLARAKQTVSTATFSDRKRVLSVLKETLDAGHDEQERIHEVAEKLEGAAHDQFEEAEKIAESRREDFEESYEELEDAEAGQWELRKNKVASNIEQYSMALERARSLAGASTRMPQR